MQMDFTRAKIDSLTLGERLERLRKNEEFDLEELAKNLKIKPSYIEALESGDYKSLPNKVYVRGFISAYARYFGVPEKKLVKIFDREYRIYENIHYKKEFFQQETLNRLPSLPKIVLTSQTLIFLVVSLLIGLAVLYLFFGVRKFVASPWLTIQEPTSGITTDKQEITVTGMTKNDAKVFINNQLVQVGLDGVFSEKIGLSQGYNEIIVKSINRFEKESIEKIIVNAKFKEIAPIISPVEEKKISLKIKAVDDILLKVSADDISVFENLLKKGEEKEFFAIEKIVVSTDDGKNTLISFENSDFEKLGEKNEAIKNKVFQKESESLNEN